MWLRILLERRSLKIVRQEVNIKLAITSPDAHTSNLSGLGVTRGLDITPPEKSQIDLNLSDSSPEANHRRLLRNNQESPPLRSSNILNYSSAVTQDHSTTQVLRHNQNAMRRPDSTLLHDPNIQNVSNVDLSYQTREEVDNSIYKNDMSVEEAFVSKKTKKKQKKTKKDRRIHIEPTQESIFQSKETKMDLSTLEHDGDKHINNLRQPQQINSNFYRARNTRDISKDNNTNNPLETKDSNEKYRTQKKSNNSRDYPQQDLVRISNYNNDKDITYESRTRQNRALEGGTYNNVRSDSVIKFKEDSSCVGGTRYVNQIVDDIMKNKDEGFVNHYTYINAQIAQRVAQQNEKDQKALWAQEGDNRSRVDKYLRGNT